MAEKDWRVDILPIVFFGFLVIAKTYPLVGYLETSGHVWNLLTDAQSREAAGSGIGYYLTGQFSYLAYYLTALAFDALVLYSFLVRRGASARPKGFWENIFPLITVFVPVLGYTLLFLPVVRDLMPRYPEELLRWMSNITPVFPFYMNMLGFLLGLLGAAFSIWSIAHLRASFGLRTAVRELVTSGPYRRIRHPLYVGEIIHIFGLSILAATPAAFCLFAFAVSLQVVRAKIEERKFLNAVPEYAEFRRRTGFLWPKLG
jgi:protein-S-isoprenylcysteine O-methyltransferase Ste14